MAAAGRWWIALVGTAGFASLATLWWPLAASLPGGAPAAGPASPPSVPEQETVYATYSVDYRLGPTGTVAIGGDNGRIMGKLAELAGRTLFFEQGGRVLGLRRPEEGQGVQLVEFDPSLRRIRRVLYRVKERGWVGPLVPEFSRSPLVAGRFHLLLRRGPDLHMLVVDIRSGKLLREINLGKISLGEYALSLVLRDGGRGSGDSASILFWDEDGRNRRRVYVEMDAATGRVLSRATFKMPESPGCSLYSPSLATFREGRLWEEVFCVGEVTLPAGYSNIDVTADYMRELDLRAGRVIREIDVRLGCGDGGYLSCSWDQTLHLWPGGRHLYRVGLERTGVRAYFLRVDLDSGEKQVRVSSLGPRPQDRTALGPSLGRIAAGLFSSRVALASGFGPPWSREAILSRDGRLLVTNYDSYPETLGGLWAFDTRALRLAAHLLPGRQVGRDHYALSPDGRRLYVLDGERKILVADTATGKVLRELSLPQDLHLLSLVGVGRAPAGADAVPGSRPDARDRRAAPATGDLGKIAFIRQGDLWLRGLPGGAPRRLTRDGLNRAPRWSPSGRWLAFLKAGRVWTARADGASGRPVTGEAGAGEEVTAFAWSPVRDELAFTTASGSLRVVSADEGRPRELAASVRSFAWSRDGAWLAYSRYRPAQPGPDARRPDGSPGTGIRASLRLVRPDGTGDTEVLGGTVPFGAAGSRAAASVLPAIVAGWLPGGRVLAWRDPLSPSLLADGTPLEAIARDGRATALVGWMLAYDDFLAASPDGRRLAAVEGAGRESWTGKRLAVLDAATGERRVLSGPGEAAASPVWSPDGRRLAFTAAPDLGPGGLADTTDASLHRRAFVANPDGSGRRRLVREGAYADLPAGAAYGEERPLWSADGSHVLLVRVDEVRDRAQGEAPGEARRRARGEAPGQARREAPGEAQGGKRASLWLVPAAGGRPLQVADRLSQRPGDLRFYGDAGRAEDAIPYYGHMDWAALFDWWRGPARGENASAAAALDLNL